MLMKTENLRRGNTSLGDSGSILRTGTGCNLRAQIHRYTTLLASFLLNDQTVKNTVHALLQNSNRMIKKLLPLLFLFFTVATIAQNVPQKPNPPRRVNDFGDVLTRDQIESLERKLVNYDDSTSTQIDIVTVLTTGAYDIDDYALKILRDWGVGNKKLIMAS